MIARPTTSAPTVHPVLAALLASPVPAVMGILNVTPDSFSDGGQFDAPERALAQARRMIAEGAGIIDIGAESTRPYGSRPVTADEEWARLVPVLADVVALGTPVSIDSMKASVVAKALAAGVAIANDIWGLQRDPDMARVIAEHSAPVVVMHNRDDRRWQHRYRRRHEKLLRALAGDRRQGRHSCGPHRTRPRHRLRQDA